MKNFLVTFLFIGVFIQTVAQQKKVVAHYIDAEIILDGRMDEPFWDQVEAAKDFQQFFPTDSIVAIDKTEVKFLYNDHTLYVGVTAYSKSNDYIVSTLKRDFSGTTNDNVSILFDTFSDGANAYAFGVTPLGVQREILVSDGGIKRDGFNSSWDTKWLAESSIGDQHYTVEFAIPFSSIKFKEGVNQWRFRAYRWNLQTNEQSTWVKVPQNQMLSSLAYMGTLEFDNNLGKSKSSIAVIPYINGFSQKDFLGTQSYNDFSFGGDAKISVGDGLNLDLTINPDFSNVEVDDIVTNLTRFELFLPEKRQFFMDNSDLFTSFGNFFNEARPFFSRRVGLTRDKDGVLIQNRIIGGARLSGKLDQNWRIGVLDIITDEDLDNEIASSNNAMLALQRKVGQLSNIGAFIVNRQTLGDHDFVEENQQYNRVVGVDYNLATDNNKFVGKAYVHKSFQPDDTEGNISSQLMMNYTSKNWRLINDLVYVDEDFKADLGFVPRTDIIKSGEGLTRYFYPKNSKSVSQNSLTAMALHYWSPSRDFMKTDRTYSLSWSALYKDASTLSINGTSNYIYLFWDFDPTRSGGEALPGDRGYTYKQIRASYASSRTSVFTYNLNAVTGQFFNGHITTLGGTLNYRFQPWVNLSMMFNYNGVKLPDPYSSANLWLISPKVDVSFTKKLFWSTTIQYNSQAENLGINSRLQWRFAPLSDLYIVYNDNYNTDGMSPKFRSINLKATYWLNL